MNPYYSHLKVSILISFMSTLQIPNISEKNSLGIPKRTKNTEHYHNKIYGHPKFRSR